MSLTLKCFEDVKTIGLFAVSRASGRSLSGLSEEHVGVPSIIAFILGDLSHNVLVDLGKRRPRPSVPWVQTSLTRGQELCRWLIG